jgi:hypothetical protein
MIDPRLQEQVRSHPCSLLFATISGQTYTQANRA